MEHSQNIQKIDPKEETFCLKWTKYNNARKLRKIFMKVTHKLKIVMYRFRDIL